MIQKYGVVRDESELERPQEPDKEPNEDSDKSLDNEEK